jgi:hypothetical protein
MLSGRDLNARRLRAIHRQPDGHRHDARTPNIARQARLILGIDPNNPAIDQNSQLGAQRQFIGIDSDLASPQVTGLNRAPKQELKTVPPSSKERSRADPAHKPIKFVLIGIELRLARVRAKTRAHDRTPQRDNRSAAAAAAEPSAKPASALSISTSAWA